MPSMAIFPSLLRVLLALVTLIPTETHDSSLTLHGKRLERPPYCSGQVLSGAHRYRTMWSRTKLECVGRCGPEQACRSIVWDEGSEECHLGDSKAYDNCSNMESASGPLVSFYQEPPPCGEKEVMGPMGFCVCAQGFTGSPCTRYFHDCSDIRQYGTWRGDGEYTVHPLLARHPFQVYCRHISSTRTYILDRRKNNQAFTRPWADYRDGFGPVGSDHWLGLENIHALTADRAQEMRANIKVQNTSNYILTYMNFRISDQASGYRLSINTSLISTANDCLLDLHNAKFSTYDHDNDDNDDVNCAQLRGGGFWFRGSACSTCNPSGELIQPETGLRQGTEDEAFWDSVLGNVALFKVSMYLMPVNV